MAATEEGWHPVAPRITDPDLAPRRSEETAPRHVEAAAPRHVAGAVGGVTLAVAEKSFFSEHKLAIGIAIAVAVIVAVIVFMYVTRKKKDGEEKKNPAKDVENENAPDLEKIRRLRDERKKAKEQGLQSAPVDSPPLANPPQSTPQRESPQQGLPAPALQNLPQQASPLQNLPQQNLPQQNLPQQASSQQASPQQSPPQQTSSQQGALQRSYSSGNAPHNHQVQLNEDETMDNLIRSLEEENGH